MKNTQIYDVFNIIETNKEDVKNRWNKVGTGFLNRDGSINIVLDAYPVNGRLHVRVRQINGDGGPRPFPFLSHFLVYFLA